MGNGLSQAGRTRLSRLRRPSRTLDPRNFMENGPTRGRKRRSAFDADESETVDGQLVKRIRVDATGDYVHQIMFVEGRNHDVVVSYGQKVWHLHRSYIRQSEYFSAIFNGSWKDSTDQTIPIPMVDENVTVQSLNVALGSMYNGVLTLKTDDVVEIAAASSLLQLPALLEACGDFMLCDIRMATAAKFFLAADRYGLPEARAKTREWLLFNAFGHGVDMQQSLNILRQLPPWAIKLMVSHADLVAAPCETYIYQVVSTWMYLHLHGRTMNPVRDAEEIVKEAADFFQKRPGPAFIVSDGSQPYREILQSLKLQQIVMFAADLECLKRDNILDDAMIFAAMGEDWARQLHLGSPRPPENSVPGPFGAPSYVLIEEGPQLPLTMEQTNFFDRSCRFGKFITVPGARWRWSTFLFGIRFFVSVTADSIELIFVDSTAIDMYRLANGQSARDGRFIAIRLRYFQVEEKGAVLRGDTGIVAEEAFERDRSLMWTPAAFNLPHFSFPAVVALDLAVCRREELVSFEPGADGNLFIIPPIAAFA